MRDIDDDYPTLDVFDAIHRELITIIGHCTFHRSLLQDLILRSAAAQGSPASSLQRWREESIAGVEQLRFSDLNKQDKELATAVHDEASRIAESFWNVLLSRAQVRDRIKPGHGSIASAQSAGDAHGALDGTRG